MWPEENYISGKVVQIDGERAFIEMDDSQTLSVPLSKISPCKEGENCKIVIVTPEMEEQEREDTAKRILSEILKTNET